MKIYRLLLLFFSDAKYFPLLDYENKKIGNLWPKADLRDSGDTKARRVSVNVKIQLQSHFLKRSSSFSIKVDKYLLKKSKRDFVQGAQPTSKNTQVLTKNDAYFFNF